MQIKLLTKYALLSDCQRRSLQLRDALTTATTQVLITLQAINESDVIKLQVKAWTVAKHELVKHIQGEEKRAERSRLVRPKPNVSSVKRIDCFISERLALCLGRNHKKVETCNMHL